MFAAAEAYGTQLWKGFKSDSLPVKYVSGSTHCGRHWKDVDNVLLPVNVFKSHWVVLCLDLNTWEINAFSSTKNPTLRTALTPLAKILPVMYNQLGFNDMKPVKAKLQAGGRWKINIMKAPQQLGGGDCGIFALKFIEYMAYSKNPSKVIADKIEWFCWKAALDMYVHGKTYNDRT